MTSLIFLNTKTKPNMQTQYSLDLNQFKLQGKIEDGPFGGVYQAKENNTGKIFIAKVYNQQIEEESYTKSFKSLINKSKSISNFDHPSIAKFIGFSPVNFQ